ncbi:hypothetical protein CRM22_001263 [Opisthorchis felineus]|uniref:RH1 domain-containing protein n=1 Tax=Opisthorchis felineus TaxID=147828 RepID=A0A4S2MBF2_OPIFE|nr:hypothetical protein CRM22_001263 [Opisthorchis felineus]
MPTDGVSKCSGPTEGGLTSSCTTTSSPVVNEHDHGGLSAPSQSPKTTGAQHVTRDAETKVDDESTSSLSDFYLSESHLGQLDLNVDSNCTSPNSGPVMSEYVQRIASVIYSEFEAMIEAYGLPVVERLMPLVIGVLENLDELHKDQAAYHAEVDQLREQCGFLKGELEREMHRRKQSELRLLQAEDAFEEDRKAKEEKLEELTTACRQAELRFANTKDQLSRMEAKEAEWKKDGVRLHERINELIRSNLELTNQVKFANRQRPTSGRPSQVRMGSSAAPAMVLYEDIVPEPTSTSHPESGITFDATSGGFGFDEMPSNEEGACLEDEIPAGMWKEIDTLIKENMELVETKNALNVVKDDLLAKIDSLTFENTSLRESVAHLTQVRSRLQSELACTDQLLNNARSEVDELKEKVTTLSSKKEDSGGAATMHKKRFTRAEMSRVLSERNQYKERLMELQETIRFTETLRAGQKGHPELLIGLSGAGTKLTNASAASGSSTTSQSGRLQSLQNFFAAFSAGHRADAAGDRCGTPTGQNATLQTPVSHSWVTLSHKYTESPIYGWCQGLNPSGTPTLIRTKTSPDTSFSGVPMPVQCRMVGGLHRRQLEIAAALVVPISSASPRHSRIWLIGRGPVDVLATSGSPGTSVGSTRGYVGQVHIFEPNRFSQPVHSFDLDPGFMPTSAMYVQQSSGLQPCPITTEGVRPDGDDLIRFAWEFVVTDVNPEADHVILASNDGRFLLLRVADDLTSTHPDLDRKDAWITARFQVVDTALVANCMISVNQFACLSLSNPNGLSQLVCMNLGETLRNAQQTNLSTHALLSIPGEAKSTGPMVMTREVSTTTTEGKIWLGTAGAGQCHCFSPQILKFIHILTLPTDTPCLHAIEVQPVMDSTSTVVWLAVSGSGTVAHALNGDPLSSPMHKDDANKGMARLLAFDAERQEVLRRIDLTCALSAMIDTEGVTDPVDLTICRLLFVTELDKSPTVWFATRSGFVGRLPVDNLHADPNDLEVLSANSISVSCHGYRRPVCNLITIKDTDSAGEFLVVAVGHDYVHLRPQQLQASEQAAGDQATGSFVFDSLSRLRQMGSGAHAIVWRINSTHA